MWKIPCFSFVSLFDSCQQSHTTKKGPGRSLRSAHWWGPSQFDQETKFPSPPSSYQMWQKALEKWRSSDCVDPGGNPSRRSKKCRALLGQERRTQRSQCVPSVLGATESQYVRHQDQCTPWITRTPGPVAVCPLLDAEEPTFQQDSTAAAEMLDQGKGWKGLHHKELGILKQRFTNSAKQLQVKTKSSNSKIKWVCLDESYFQTNRNVANLLSQVNPTSGSKPPLRRPSLRSFLPGFRVHLPAPAMSWLDETISEVENAKPDLK